MTYAAIQASYTAKTDGSALDDQPSLIRVCGVHLMGSLSLAFFMLPAKILIRLGKYRTGLCRNNVKCVFSSPEPKAHGELIVYQSSRRPSVRACVRLSVRASVHTFKHYYLHNQQAYANQILSEPLFGWGKGFIRFWTRLVWNSGFHGNQKPP